jgi:hypothetical protein
MKLLRVVLAMCLCSGCATLNKLAPKKKKPVAEKTSSSLRKRSAKVRTDECVKAYPVGRYTDPNYPDEMHERHTLYRREESADWNYLPDAPYALPLGPTVANSDPSQSYYVKADAEQMNAQQKAYAEALQEQNRALKKRIESMQHEAGKVPELQRQIDRLKRDLDALPSPTPTPKGHPSSPEPEGFSSTEPPVQEEPNLFTKNTP